MFIGHYGIGFMLKRKFRDFPLWLFFLMLQLPDLIAFILVFFGVERAAYRDNINPFLRNEFVLTYSHSLAGTIILCILVYALFINIKDRTWASIAALSVFSHWVIDFIVHTSDMSVFFGSVKVGLGLWEYPWISYGLEILLVAGGWLALKYRNIFSYLLLIVLAGSFTGMIFGSEPELIREEQSLRSLILLVSNILFIVLAYDSERKQAVSLSSVTDGMLRGRE